MDEARRPTRGQGANHGQYGSLRPVMAQAVEEAAARGSMTVEAQDLLLALATAGDPETMDMMDASGLGRRKILDALAAERLHSLAYIGLVPPDDGRLAAAPRVGRPGWGTSVREALGRGRVPLNRNRGRRPAEADILTGILLAPLGTVPRALALAGIDADTLIGRLQRERAQHG